MLPIESICRSGPAKRIGVNLTEVIENELAPAQRDRVPLLNPMQEGGARPHAYAVLRRRKPAELRFTPKREAEPRIAADETRK